MIYADTLIQILTPALLAAYALILFKSRLNAKVVRRSALIILLSGMAVFMYGYRLEGYDESFVTSLLRALLDSVKLFIYDCDYLEVAKAQTMPLYADVLLLVFYSAMLTSLSAIIMLFGKRAMTFLVLTFKKKPFRHVFVGINSRSLMIAKGIKGEEIAFIEFPGDSKEEEFSVKSVLKSVSGVGADGGWDSKQNVTYLRAGSRPAKRNSSDRVFEQMGLGKMRRLVDGDTAFYILSEDNERNLQETLVLVSDKDLKNNTIHSSVRREGLSSSYKLVLAKTGVHFIYPSSLSVVEMMKNSACHPSAVMEPVLSVDGKPTGMVRNPFTAQIIGFGETGQAALKFIYEFSSAMGPDGNALPVKIYVDDDRMDSLKGHFVFSVPDMEHDDIISYEGNGTDTGAFWNNIMSRLDDLNCIVISMKDDGPNLDLACTIFTYAMKKRRGGFRDFRIFVRKRYTPDYEKRLVGRMNEKAGSEVIICFGEYEKIFTSGMIVSKSASGINSSATSIADRLRESYEGIVGAGAEGAAEISGRMTFSDKRKRRIETHQYISRANHVATKLRFTCGGTDVSDEALENLARVEHLRYSRYLLAHGYSYAPEDDDVLKTNHQICAWESLSESDREYHRNMTKASLTL